MYCDNKGFTLVEVVVASTILFSAIAVGTLAYRTSLRSVDKITVNVFISHALPPIMERVKAGIMSRKTRGKGRFGDAVTYTWNARTVKTSKNIISSYDERTGGLEYGRFNVALNKVYLTITYQKDTMSKKTTYEYHELSWAS